jgi:hypothetical protein
MRTIRHFIPWTAHKSEQKEITFIIGLSSVLWKIVESAQLTDRVKLKVNSTTLYKHQTYQHHKVQTASDLYVSNLSSSFVPVARLSLILHGFCHQTQVGWQISIYTDMDLQQKNNYIILHQQQIEKI